MSKVKYDVVANIGTYTKDGEEKTRYMNCGIVVQNGDNFSMKLNAVPVTPDWSGWFSLFKPKAKDAPARTLDEPPY